MRTNDSNARRGRAPWLHAVAMMLMLVGCATNPVTGKKELSLVSSGQEQQMGAEGFKAAIAEYGTYDDAGVQKYVSDLGNRLAAVSHMPQATWKFTVIDDDAVNAFAMPGGYIFITRGIMTHLANEAQLAGVMGHEIGHVTHRHSAEQITREQLSGVGLAVGAMLSPAIARYGQAAQQGLQLMFLSYSRTAESQADELGVQYSTAAGFDSRQMPRTYEMLKRVSDKAGQRLPSFLSTHPDPGDREVRTTELSRAATAGKTGLIVNGPEYLDRLEGMVYGQDPRQGYFEGAEFYHPALRFILTMPAGWKYQNTHEAILAGAPDQSGVMQVTLGAANGLAPDAFVAQLQSSGKIQAARGASETIGGNPAWVGQVQVPSQSGGEPQVLAAAFIRRSPTEMFQILGQSANPSDGTTQKILASARSLRPLTDPARLSPEPARVHIVRAPSAGTFSSIVAGLGKQGVDLDELAIINNVNAEDRIAAGTRIKTVSPARVR
jgi:predicted Zn-dependent protease